MNKYFVGLDCFPMSSPGNDPSDPTWWVPGRKSIPSQAQIREVERRQLMHKQEKMAAKWMENRLKKEIKKEKEKKTKKKTVRMEYPTGVFKDYPIDPKNPSGCIRDR